MNILSSDWISAVGWLYSAPFVGENFLYRLRDIGYSLLLREVHAIRPSEIEETVVGDVRTITIRPPPMQVGQPRNKAEDLLSLFLHVAQSEDISLRELIEVAPIQIKPSEDFRKTKVFDKITVCMEPCQLLIENMLRSDYIFGPSETVYNITDTAFRVRVPLKLKERVFNPKRKTGPFGDFCRISIINNQDGQCYDAFSTYEWDLTVIGILHSNGRAGRLGHLERKSG